MNIGDQIKALRLRKGITQETLAQHFGVTSQAVSKWERGAAYPDIGMLPELSAYFGVSIDSLFSLSDETRLERIENMIWDVRFFDPAEVEKERQFLLAQARKCPEDPRPHKLLAAIENHLAQEHRDKAAEYAREALCRDPNELDAHSELISAMQGCCPDWIFDNHSELIRYYEDFMRRNPDSWHGCMWLLDQLLDDNRLEEAAHWQAVLEQLEHTWRAPLYRGRLLWQQGKQEQAHELWQQLLTQYPDRWNIPSTIADHLAREGHYEQAILWHRKSIPLAKPPRFTDPWISIAQLCQILGDYPGAIQALEEQLEVLAQDWGITQGETADEVHRTIARLKTEMQTK